MDNFLTQINLLSLLEDEEALELARISKPKFYAKEDCILRKDQIARKLYFINKGLVKLSFYKEDKEFIMRFFCENEFCAALDNFVTQKPSAYIIIALEDSHVIEIDYTDLNMLADKFHSIEKIFRKIASMAIVNMMHRISEMLESNATERYNSFLKENGHIINRINLGDLSGYLGISQVSLSRIRRNK